MTIAYDPTILGRPLHLRRAALQKWGFICNCARCLGSVDTAIDTAVVSGGDGGAFEQEIEALRQAFAWASLTGPTQWLNRADVFLANRLGPHHHLKQELRNMYVQFLKSYPARCLPRLREMIQTNCAVLPALDNFKLIAFNTMLACSNTTEKQTVRELLQLDPNYKTIILDKIMY